MYYITYEEDLLEKNFLDLEGVDKFFTASINKIQLDKFNTDVVLIGGMNPWESCEKSLYPLNLAFVELIKVVFFIAFVIFL